VLRLLGLNTTPEHHAAFFRDGLRELPAAPRVLISGTADYSLLARLLPAFDERGMRASVTVVDRCETALMLNRWYAEKLGIEIATTRSDALDYAETSGFDLVCTHSFLGQFDAQRRLQLLAAWRRMLKPGGLLLTINRLRPGAGADWLGYSAQQAALLADNVRERVALAGGLIGATADDLAAAALRYARNMGAWPLRSEDEIRSLCEASGFRVEQLTSQPVVLAAGKGLSGPTMPGGAPYAHLAARRL
jgi:SAM-dependent methyltransferase